MNRNLTSLGLLRNGKVYGNKQLAIQGLTQVATNDGVAKLARYLDERNVIRTVVGFYANAAEMEDASGGTSSYTVLDIEGSAVEIQEIRNEIAVINSIIGNGISGTTLTASINDINSRLGDGFTSENTVAKALADLRIELSNALAVTIEESSSADYAKVYTIKQGGTEIGVINIPKDIVIKEGKLVYGYWSGDTFIEDEEGPDAAIKLVLNNDEVIYINAKDLVETYTAGDGIEMSDNVISIKYNRHSEEFLVIDSDGIKVEGIQAAIDAKAESERLYGSDGISIVSNNVKAVAARYSSDAVSNPITVGKDGIKFAKELDCGYFDSSIIIASSYEDVNGIENPSEADVFISGQEALSALSTKKIFKSIEVSNVDADEQIYLYSTDYAVLDNVEITGNKGSSNGYFLYSSPLVDISNVSLAQGAKPYNIFEGDQNVQNLEVLNATNVNIQSTSLMHNVFNIYSPKDDAVINITNSKFNLDVNNSNVLRISNLNNATNVTVNFEDVEWTYENTLNKDVADWNWAGLIIYQPYSTDSGISGDLAAMRTWRFNFKNCKYNGVKVNSNNFEKHNQVFYMYNIGGDESVKDPAENGLVLDFS